MGQEIFCCADVREKQKKQSNDNVNRHRHRNKNVEFVVLTAKQLEERKEFNKEFMDLRNIAFKNMQTQLSKYVELEENWSFQDLEIQKESYDLYYKNVLNTSLQQKFTQQIFRLKNQDNKEIEKHIQFLLKLDHPFLPSFVEFFQEEMEYKIILSQLPNYTLKSLIEQQVKFDEKDIWLLGQTLLQFAHYLNRNRLISFSFTPENIFIQNPKNFKLVKMPRFTESIEVSSQL